jgi:hypothetical protein
MALLTMCKKIEDVIQLLDFVRPQFKKTETKHGDVQVRMWHSILNSLAALGTLN